MELNINSPAYYSQEYWVDDEIYWMCRQLAAAVRENKYSDIIDVIGIVPIAAPDAIIEKGLYKEHKRCEPEYGFASVSLHINFEEYVKADISGKKRLMIKNILASVKAVSKKGKIDYRSFEKDVVNFCRDNDIAL